MQDGEPLPGASIVIKGTTIGTLSDKDGKFELTDPNPKTDEKTGSLMSEITVSFVGKKTIEIHLKANSEADKNGTYTFKLEDAVILIDTELPSLPPPPPARR